MRRFNTFAKDVGLISTVFPMQWPFYLRPAQFELVGAKTKMLSIPGQRKFSSLILVEFLFMKAAFEVFLHLLYFEVIL